MIPAMGNRKPSRRTTEDPFPAYPDGWKGGSDDFSFIRTFDSNLAINVNSEDTADQEWRRNAATKSDFEDG